jgi:hypothetical protein
VRKEATTAAQAADGPDVGLLLGELFVDPCSMWTDR